jgi:hypothetical protein
MERLLSDDALREKLGAKARESRGRFSPERVLDCWMELLGETCR